ncbi:MAG: large conductance mechanosensitive channel protein MscL [Pseudomonadota bacterium]
MPLAPTGILKSFKEFALKGNIVDLAVAVVVGGAFSKIVTSLVSDIVMPLINPLIPGGDWREATVGQGIKIGAFAGTLVDFTVVALVLFFVISTIARLKQSRDETLAPPTISEKPSSEENLARALDRLNSYLEKKLP